MCLGDLERYKELYSMKEDKDYRESLKFYEKAALLMPDIGNAHNQLAVLATYSEAESTALYHYCRSIMAKNPFSGGFANIAQLFENNLANYESFQSIRSKGFDFNSQHGESVRFKMLLSNFVHLNGVFFAWSVRMHLEFLRATNPEPSTSQSSDVSESTTMLSKLNDTVAARILRNERELKPERLHQLSAVLLEDFDALLNDNKISNLHLIRFVSICIFTAHFADMPDSVLLSSSDASFAQFLQATYDSQATTDAANGTVGMGSPVQRTLIQSQVLCLLFSLVTKAAMKLVPLSSQSETRPSHDRSLTLILVFMMWLEQHPEHLRSAEEIEEEDIALPAVFSDSLSMDTNSNMPWKRKFCVSKEQGRYEQRLRSILRATMLQLKDRLSVQYPNIAMSSPPTQSDPSCRLMLRDVAEMRGFLPLRDVIEQYFVGFHGLKQSLKWYPAAAGKLESCRIIYRSIDKIFEKPFMATSSSQQGGTENEAMKLGRPRQLFDPHADAKPSPSTYASQLSKKDKGASKKAIPNKEKIQLEEGTEKKRTKLRENQPRSVSVLESSDAKDKHNNSVTGGDADAMNGTTNNSNSVTNLSAVSNAVSLGDVSASHYSFFNVSGPRGEKEGLWDYCLGDEVQDEEISFEKLNQSIMSEIGSDMQLGAAMTGFVPSLTEHILRQSTSAGSLQASGGEFVSSRGSLSANPSQYMSPAISAAQLHPISTHQSFQSLRHDEDDYFEDVVFRPAFPKETTGAVSSSQTADSNVLDSHLESSNHHNNSIWAQFGIDSNSPLILLDTPSTGSANASFAFSLPGAAGLSDLEKVAAENAPVSGLGIDWNENLLRGPSSSVGIGFEPSTTNFREFDHGQDFFMSLSTNHRETWMDSGASISAVDLLPGTGLSATSRVSDISKSMASYSGPSSSVKSTSSSVNRVSLSAPPGLSINSS